MANLVRRESREGSRAVSPEYRWDPFRVIEALFRPDQVAGDWSGFTSGGDFIPRLDVKETKDAFVLKADLPGVKEEDLDVSLNGNQLTITGKREEEHREEGERYYAVERSSGTFARALTLPDSVDSEHVTAEMKNGVLNLTIPKKAEAQPKKISVGKDQGESTAKA